MSLLNKMSNFMKRFCLLMALLLVGTMARSQEQPRYLEPWQKGYFDIHCIATGKGECTFFIYPDGTTMLIDLGDMTGAGKGWAKSQALPDSTRTPAWWAARYIDHFSPNPGRIDYVMLTHFHSDHMGSGPALREGPNGYKICGLLELAEYEKFGKLVDRGYPTYDFPSEAVVMKMNAAVMPEYRKFVIYQTMNNGMKAESFEIGSRKQFAPLHKTPDFEAWNVAGSASVTTGKGSGTREMYTENPKYFDENMFSNVMLFRYGPFKYFTGGDLSGNRPSKPGSKNRDYESQVVDFCAPCNVIKANHHGYRDATNPYFLWKMAPDVVIFEAAEASHPCIETVTRISDKMYPGKRMMYATSQAGREKLGEEAWSKIAAWGHIVVRVQPGGAAYKVYVLDALSADYRIVSESELLPSLRDLIEEER